jgi:hypothetical protein
MLGPANILIAIFGHEHQQTETVVAFLEDSELKVFKIVWRSLTN